MNIGQEINFSNGTSFLWKLMAKARNFIISENSWLLCLDLGEKYWLTFLFLAKVGPKKYLKLKTRIYNYDLYIGA